MCPCYLRNIIDFLKFNELKNKAVVLGKEILCKYVMEMKIYSVLIFPVCSLVSQGWKEVEMGNDNYFLLENIKSTR